MRRSAIGVAFLVAAGLAACDGGAEEGAQDASTTATSGEPFGSSRGPDASQDHPDAGTETVDAGGSSADDAAATDTCPDSAGLLIVARELMQRKVDLDTREMDLVSREQQISLLEETIGKRSVDLMKLKSDADALLSRLEATPGAYDPDEPPPEVVSDTPANAPSEDRERRLAHLADTLKGMRASSSAGVLASMESEEDAVDLLTRMSARQAAGVLGAMPPGKAAVLAQRMLGTPGADTSGAVAQGAPR